MLKNIKRAAFALILSGMAVSLVQAQNTGTQQPLPPIAPTGPQRTVGTPVETPGDASTTDNQQLTVPDTRPPAGAQDFTLGSTESGHNFLLPSFTVVTQVGTNPTSATQPGRPDILSTTYLAGRLALNRTSGRSQLLMDYIAAGAFSNDQTIGNFGIQGLDASEMIRWGRWSLLVGDQFNYTSDSLFGFGGLGGLNNLGVSSGGATGTSPGLTTPGDSVFINGTSRINNAAVGQVTYDLSHRSSLTFVGSYGVLDFINAPLQNTTSYSGQAGYTYLLSPQNSITVLYRYDAFSFSKVAQGISDHTAQFVFARKITGRLSMQVGGGPAVQVYNAAVTGSGTAVSPSVFAALKYRRRYTGLGFNYSHGLTNGSGVLPGASTDSFTGLMTRSFSRNWDTAVYAGYARNQFLKQTLTAPSGASPHTWYASAQVNRRFVGYSALFLTYGVSGQSSLSAICTVPGCLINTVTHTVSIGYTWGLRPIIFE